jgi:hypothetical protein
MRRLLFIIFVKLLFSGDYPSYGPEDQWNTIVSTQQAFIIFDNITLNEVPIDNGEYSSSFSGGECENSNCDIIAGIYNGHVIGWSFMPFTNGTITLAINLHDGVTPGLDNYPSVIPNVFDPTITFNFYDASEGKIYYNVTQSGIQAGYFVSQGHLNIIESGEFCSSNGFEFGPQEEYCLYGNGCNLSESEFFDAIGNSNLDCNGLTVEDCNGEIGGDAYFDDCQICSGGNTGIMPNDNGCVGCTYEVASNFNQYVQLDDGSCEFGPIGEMIEYELIEGNNLISYSGIDNCETIAALGDFAPGIVFIIGQGVGLFYDEGNQGWIGNLTNLNNTNGYWINTSEPINDFIWSEDCPESTSLGLGKVLPDLFDYNQSTEQAFYLINNISINNKSANEGDILLAYNNDVLVGATYYNDEITTLPVMGKDRSPQTNGFLIQGDKPFLRLYEEATGEIINLESDLEEFSNLLVSKVETVIGNTELLPLDYNLNPAYPNPFNPITNISYLIPEEKEINISIYDIDGRKVETLVQSKKSAGRYTLKWNAKYLASGLYFVKLNAGEFTQTQKLMLVK